MFSILVSICLSLRDLGESVCMASGSYADTLVRGEQGTCLVVPQALVEMAPQEEIGVPIPKGRIGKLASVRVLY